MAISLNELRTASQRFYKTKLAKSLYEAKSQKKQTAFLSHSHKDEDLAKGLQTLLVEDGWDVYIDWQDSDMPEKPDKETATKIKTKISGTDWFLFLATPNSIESKWCPWEIGFADSVKNYDHLLIVPTSDQSGHWYGNEYLQLYKKIDTGSSTLKTSGYAVYDPGAKNGTWIQDLK